MSRWCNKKALTCLRMIYIYLINSDADIKWWMLFALTWETTHRPKVKLEVHLLACSGAFSCITQASPQQQTESAHVSKNCRCFYDFKINLLMKTGRYGWNKKQVDFEWRFVFAGETVFKVKNELSSFNLPALPSPSLCLYIRSTGLWKTQKVV